jgi:hypothetical protein
LHRAVTIKIKKENMPWEKTENEIRHRIQEPGLFDPDSFRRKNIAPGIDLILGKKKGKDTMETQAIRFDKDNFTLEEAKKWLADHKKDFSKNTLETRDIKGIEIFAAGTWNSDIYSISDLDKMVEAYNATKTKVKPFLKLGHNEMQPLLEADGLPAAGWIDNLRRVGEKLVADFVGVPKAIYELIKAGSYRTVSSEIYWNFALDGEKYPYLLKAVAILGADIPAVSSLKDIMSLYARGEPATAYIEGAEVRIYEIKTEEIKMEKEMKELQEKLANAEKLFTEEQTKSAAYAVEKEGMTASMEEMKGKCVEMTTKCNELQTKCDELSKKYSEVTEASRVVEINTKIDELITAKKVLPAQKEILFTIIKNMPREAKYSIDGKEEALEGLVMKFAETYTPINLPTDPAANGKAPEVKKFNNDDDEKHAAIEKYMAEHKTSYTKAYEAITLEARTEAAKGKAE